MKKKYILLCIVILLFGCEKKNIVNDNKNYCNDEKGVCGINKESILDYDELHDENHMFVITSMDEAIQIFENKKDAVIYFGYPGCPWCAEAVPIMNNCAKKYNQKINYVKTKDKNGKYLYTDQQKEKLFSYIKDYLDCDEKGEKHLFVPYVIVIKNGKVVNFHLGTVTTHDSENRKMTEKEKHELNSIYDQMFSND